MSSANTAATLVCRRAVMQVGVISRAAGSAYAEIGRTKLMVAVYGPRPSVRVTEGSLYTALAASL